MIKSRNPSTPGGNDYAVFKCKAQEGKTPYERQNDAFELADWSNIPSGQIPVIVTGFGHDGGRTAPGAENDCRIPCYKGDPDAIPPIPPDPDAEEMQMQQSGKGSAKRTTHLGKDVATHTADTCAGNSGSPIIVQSGSEVGKVIGIHTAGSCKAGESGVNIGVPTNLQALTKDIQALAKKKVPAPDPHGTPPPGEEDFSFFDFGTGGSNPPIPADFFGSGSDPFVGQIRLQGDPIDPPALGDTSTLVQRSDVPVLPADPVGTEGTVDIEIVALSLVSADPITLTYNGGQDPEQWDVAVGLSDIAAPVGSLTATKTHDNGGTFDPRCTFSPS